MPEVVNTRYHFTTDFYIYINNSSVCTLEVQYKTKNIFQDDPYPKNHGISKLVVWRSQTPAMHMQTPLVWRVQ